MRDRITTREKRKKAEILIVEDEETLAIGLEYNLTEEGYSVSIAEDGKKALELFDSGAFDLIIMDIMLPYYDGFELTSIIRRRSPQIPILMLTARTSVNDRVKGIETGADDYMTKPFNLKEMLARVKGMLKRKAWYAEITDDSAEYSFGKNTVNFQNLSCRAGKSEFQLTPLEGMILKYFIDRKGQVVTRKELLENVWHISSNVETRTIDNFISRLRKRFEPIPDQPEFIKSIRGSGYMFTDNEKR